MTVDHSDKEAIDSAVETSPAHHVKMNLLDFSQQRTTKKDWVLERDGYKVVFEIIGDNILYSEPHGKLKQSYVKDLFALYIKVIHEAGFADGRRYYRILNWENYKKSQWRARKDYVQHVRKINKLYPSSLSVVFGMTPFMRFMFSISKPFIPFEIKSAKDLNQAIDLICKDQELLAVMALKNQVRTFDTQFNLEMEKYKKQLLKFMGSLEWDQKGTRDEQIEETHPFKEIFDAVSIIKSDLDDVFEERNRAASQLKQSQEKYRNILENMDDGYYEVDLNGNFLFFNETLLRLLGYSKTEFSKMNYRQIIDAKTAESVIQAFENVYQTGGPRSDFGYEMINKSGQRLYGETSISLMKDVNGTIKGFRGVVRDRTEKKALEDELIKHRDSLERMISLRTKELEEETIQKNRIKKINTSIFNISNAVNTTQSLKELYSLIHQYLNDIIEMPNFLIGIYFPEQDEIGIPYYVDQYHDKMERIPDISKGLSLSSQVLLQREPVFLSEQELIDWSRNKKRIDPVPKNWMGVPLISQGQTIGIMSARSYTDPRYFSNDDLEVLISVSNQVALAIERRRALDELHKREEKYRKLIETTSAGYWLLDESDKTVDLNQALCDMIGYQKEEIMNRSPIDFFADRSNISSFGFLGKSRQTTDRNYEVTFLTNTGRLLYAKVDATSIFDESGRFKGSFAFITDITEQKNAEKRLINETERANAMARAAQAASRAKSDFLANMSHEIRTPLNGVIGMAELLKDTELQDHQKTFVNTIGSEADSLLDIINTILDFSKIEAGKMDLEKIGFDLRKLFEDLSDMMNIRARKKDLDFFAFLDPGVPARVKGDPGRLKQIFMNLIGNALKFTSKGEIFIKGETIHQTERIARVRFEVRDTGIGIAKEKQVEIFDSFSQADGSTSRKYGGTGLGTTISKQLVELMGGSIGLDSQIGKGSVFWFELPLKVDSVTPADRDLIRTQIAGRTVLVTATRKTDRFIISKYLESFECRPVISNDTKEAIWILSQNNQKPAIDVIIADLDLPAENGFDFVQSIKRIAGAENIPIVLMTAMGAAGDGRRCRHLGISGYLHKPVKRSELKIAIAATLGMALGTDTTRERHLVTRHSIQESLQDNYHILVAEDYPTNQQIAAKHLTAEGFGVTLAEDGLQAVSKFRRNRFDLVLMDIQMPQMDGYEATRLIREIEEHRSKLYQAEFRTPIVAMTAHAMKGYREKCLAADMDDYLAKPLKKSDLMSMTFKWISQKQTGPPGSGMSNHRTLLSRLYPIDVKKALSEFENDHDFLCEILNDFMDRVKGQLEKLSAAVKDEDFETIKHLGHAIKGGSANLTAFPLSEAALEIETAGIEQNIEQAGQGLRSLKSEYKALKEYLKKNHYGLLS